jgi:Asp-tRNA(Asn)/Glu-tRNA(Gln) amidotransferase A subunit family amidase
MPPTAPRISQRRTVAITETIPVSVVVPRTRSVAESRILRPALASRNGDNNLVPPEISPVLGFNRLLRVLLSREIDEPE